MNDTMEVLKNLAVGFFWMAVVCAGAAGVIMLAAQAPWLSIIVVLAGIAYSVGKGGKS